MKVAHGHRVWPRVGWAAASVALLAGCRAGGSLQHAQHAESRRDWIKAYHAYDAAAQANPADGKVLSRLAYTRGRAANAFVARALAALNKRHPKDALTHIRDAHDADPRATSHPSQRPNRRRCSTN